MGGERQIRAKRSILVSLLGQVVTLVCGLIVPRLLLGAFQSEAYGATASITQFLAYISLLDGGVSGVARATLYKPLAENDMLGVSRVISEIKRFFRIIALIFLGYVLILACSFRTISGTTAFTWFSSFLLVIVISISVFAQYFIGISYAILLQAAQRLYITQAISIVTTVLNAILVVILVSAGSNLILVKLGSSLVFVLRPVLMWLYVKKNFALIKVKERDRTLLQQKWTGLGQHIAYFLHSNTDVAVLTVLSDLTVVAVYSVYSMVTVNIQNVVSAFSGGMEAVFGDMLARQEQEELRKTFDIYETWISFISGILFSVTVVMIIPFVRIYTSGIQDVNYIHPAFSVILALASYYFCVRAPYHAIIIAAGHFKQTRKAAYGEAVVNIVLSICLVKGFGLIGVAIGTLVAVCFRFVYYVFYLSRNILFRSVKAFLKRILVNGAVFFGCCVIGMKIVGACSVTGYVQWAIAGILVAAEAALLHALFTALFYRRHLKPIKEIVRSKRNSD